MGSFLFTIGDAKIPKKRLDEFQRNILHVFDIGGMMQLEDASLFGKKVATILWHRRNGETWKASMISKSSCWE